MMKRIQLNTMDWEDLKHAKIVEASLVDVQNLDIDDEVLAAAIDEAVTHLGQAGRQQKAYVVVAITNNEAASTAAADEGEGDVDDEEESAGARSGHPKRGGRDDE